MSHDVDVERWLSGPGMVETKTVPGAPGVVVGVRRLGLSDLLEAELAARARDPSAGKVGEVLGAELERQLVRRSIVDGDGTPVFGEADILELDEVVRAGLAAMVAERAAQGPTPVELEAIEKYGTTLDAVRARFSADLVAFYGLRSARDATDAQVVWFLKLRADFERSTRGKR